MGKQWKKWQTTFLGSKITADGDWSHEIKRCLLLGSKVMTNVDSIFKSRDITLPTKIHLVKAMVFPVVMYGCESWTIKKAEHWRTDAFELWCWRRLLRVSCTARRSNQSILKEVRPEYSLEGLVLKLKTPILWPPDAKSWLIWKDPDWRLKAGGEGASRGWGGWMASPTQWTWVWVNSGSWWWIGRPGELQFMGLQRVGHDWATELNWTESLFSCYLDFKLAVFWVFINKSFVRARRLLLTPFLLSSHYVPIGICKNLIFQLLFMAWPSSQMLSSATKTSILISIWETFNVNF